MREWDLGNDENRVWGIPAQCENGRGKTFKPGGDCKPATATSIGQTEVCPSSAIWQSKNFALGSRDSVSAGRPILFENQARARVSG
jgi:hypothetical protein